MDLTKQSKDEIVEYIKELVEKAESGNMGAWVGLARMYGAAQREDEQNKKEEEIKNKLYKDDRVQEVLILDDTMALAKVKSRWNNEWHEHWNIIVNGRRNINISENFDFALVLALCAKYGEEGASRYIYNMLNMYKLEIADKLAGK